MTTELDVAICRVPIWPHLDPVFDGLAAGLEQAGRRYVKFADIGAWVASPHRTGTRVLVGFGGMPVTAQLMDSSPVLRGLVSCVSGTDGFDMEAASARGLLVAHAPTPENFQSMAEAAVMLMLHLVHDLDGVRSDMQAGLPRPHPLKSQMLFGKTIGLVGWGRIAMATADLLRFWGVKVLVSSRRGHAIELPAHAESATLASLMKHSDVVCILAAPQNGAAPMVGAEQIAWMKPGAFFMNLSRGATTDELAVAQALHSGHLAGAALDVFRQEPLPLDSPLWQCPNLILTPHRVGHTREADDSLIPATLDNVLKLLNGEPPQWIRNPQALDAWRQRWV